MPLRYVYNTQNSNESHKMSIPQLPKVYDFELLDSKSIGEQLFRNSLQFLRDGLSLIESNPKHSIIIFWTGVELYLKSLLVGEHWSTIVRSRHKTSQNDFKSGNFISIDFKEATLLTEKLFNTKFDNRTKESFEVLQAHRNKIVHFKNVQIDDKNALEISHLFVHMSNVWDELAGLKLLTISFDESYDESCRLHDEIGQLIKNNKVILHGKYEYALNNKLCHLNQTKIHACTKCSFKSAELRELTEILSEIICHVCENNSLVLLLTCKKCHKQNFLYEGEIECKFCQSNHDIPRLIIEQSETLNGMGNCHRCGSNAVIQYSNYSFCSTCYSIFEKMESCKRCGEFVTHSVKRSSSEGCISCTEP